MNGPAREERSHRRHVTRTTGVWVAVAMLAGAIFVADFFTHVEIAVSVLYVAVVLTAVGSGHPRGVMLVGTGCATLAIASFFLSHSGDIELGVANGALSLLAIGATTFLAIKIEAANLAARQAQADLAHISRVMIISELTTSIAHEVSQPLAAIVANGNAAIRWLSRSPPDDEEARYAMDRVVREADRAGAVIARVRHLIRRIPPSTEPVDLGAVIDDSLVLLRHDIRTKRIALRTELASDLPAVLGDRVQLQQVTMNLLLNAIEALGGVDPAARELCVAAAAAGQQVTVRVEDTGTGIAAEASGRVFEPFYTTKPNGMGVGLAISRSIVEAHGGTVSMAPNAPRGAIFEFTLPRLRTTGG